MSQEDTQEILNQESEEQNEEVNEESTVDTDNTDTDTDSNDLDTDNANSSGNDKEEWTPSDEELGSLSDEEFEEFYSTGKFPESKKKNVVNTQEKNEEEPSDDETPTEEVLEDKPTQTDREKSKEKPAKETQQNELTLDQYKTFYQQLMSPFKANGKDIQPRSIEDIRSLMQMGANYTKKMQALSPVRKQAQSLVNNNISDEDLAFLIDLHKGNKDAIKKLLQKNKIDITDIDIDEENNYEPDLRNLANDKDVAFQDAVLDSKENLTKINSVLHDKWDEESRNMILQNPDLIRGLNYEIASGRFDYVQQVLEHERMLGRYNGVSDLKAYSDVLDRLALQEQQRLEQQQGNSNIKSTPKKPRKTNRTIPTAGDVSKAAPSKGISAPSKNSITKEMLFNMSDEEFNKLSVNDII